MLTPVHRLHAPVAPGPSPRTDHESDRPAGTDERGAAAGPPGDVPPAGARTVGRCRVGPTRRR